MPIMPLHVQITASTLQTTFDIHNFEPELRPSDPSPVGTKYNYVVLAQGRYDDPTQVRVFMNAEEVLALYDNLTPIVAEYRRALQQTVTKTAPCFQPTPVSTAIES